MLFLNKIKGCGYNCHKNCMKNVPNNCGINERVMSEILDEIKRKDVKNYEKKLRFKTLIHKFIYYLLKNKEPKRS